VSDKRTSAIPEEAAAAKVASDKGKLTSKDLYTMLKEKLKGLPSDVDVAMWKLQSVEESLNLDFFHDFTSNIENRYLNALQTMNQLSFSRE
jgi:hypothetical protein